MYRDKKYAQAEELLQATIAAPSFDHLTDDSQYRALYAAGGIANKLQRWSTAHAYLVRATVLPQAQYGAWRGRLEAAVRLRNQTDEVVCTATIVRRWPERLATLDDQFMVHVVDDARHKASRAVALSLLEALYAAHWKLKWGIEPSEAWRDLALLLVEDKRLPDAIDVASHVSDVYALISMRADRRFDSVVAASPARYEIPSVADRELRDLQLLADKNPRSLRLQCLVLEMLIHRRRYGAALALADSVFASVRATNFPEKLYEDYEEQYHWLLDLRVVTLQRANRWDEMIPQLISSSKLLNANGGNLSELISLARLYCDVGRPNDALAALSRVTATPSPSGLMRGELVRLRAAVQLADAAQTVRSLDYLSTHRSDDQAAYLDALVVANQPEAAAQRLIEQLLDPDWRLEALEDVQNYSEPPRAPGADEIAAQERSLIARPDVQAAIRRVGRSESYDIEAKY